MANNYPDWVLKHKKEGHYINKSGNNYYLYRGHCEYKDGKNVRIVDEYLGKITENGLIPSKGSVKTEVLVYEYGIYYFLYLLFENIYLGQIKLNKKYADTIMVFSTLKLLNLKESNLEYTALVVLYKKYNIKHLDLDIVKSEIDRVIKMMNEYLSKITFNDETKDSLSSLKLVYINKKYYLSKYDSKVDEIYENNGFEVKIWLK